MHPSCIGGYALVAYQSPSSAWRRSSSWIGLNGIGGICTEGMPSPNVQNAMLAPAGRRPVLDARLLAKVFYSIGVCSPMFLTTRPRDRWVRIE